MLNQPTKEELDKIPKLYDTENIPLLEKNVYLHFFCGQSDWWILEYDPNERLFFGIAKIFMPEMGYISFDELRDTKAFGVIEIERDIGFEVKKVKEIDVIKEWLKGFEDN